jgi:NTE family protein
MWGIVLEGGGAKGAYQMGVWKALNELGVEYDAVVGTSVGALNAAMMVQGDFDKAWELWMSVTPEMVFSDPDGLIEKLKAYTFESDHYLDYRQEMQTNLHSEGLDASPFEETIRKYVSEERIRASRVEMGLVTIDLDTNTGLELFKDDIPQGMMGEFLLASCYLPVFRDRLIGGKRYMDGGFHNNLPTNMLLERGWKKLIVVTLRPPIEPRSWPVDVDVVHIFPAKELGETLDFDNQGIRDKIQRGYQDGLIMLHGKSL